MVVFVCFSYSRDCVICIWKVAPPFPVPRFNFVQFSKCIPILPSSLLRSLIRTFNKTVFPYVGLKDFQGYFHKLSANFKAIIFWACQDQASSALSNEVFLLKKVLKCLLLSNFFQIMVASTEDELEVVVKLMDPKMEAVLDQQTLLISTEAVFQFGPITSAAPEELSIEVMISTIFGLCFLFLFQL